MWLDPESWRCTRSTCPRNLGDLSRLADSIAARGALEALTVVPQVAEDGTPGYQLAAGAATIF
jgi:hypothetical protein